MTFKGWQRTSLIEYPDRISTVLFTGGCNLRCPFCYNAELVLHPETIPDLPQETVLEYLRANRSLYQAVVVTGGEPTLAPDLPDFLARVKGMGLLCGLETNGTNPEMLEGLLRDRRVDYVAMDLKASLVLRDYRRATGLQSSRGAESGAGDLLARVRRSVELLRGSPVTQEFRLTVVPGLHDERQIAALARQLRGAPRVVLQQFSAERALDPALRKARPLPAAELRRMAARLEGRVGAVELRGI